MKPNDGRYSALDSLRGVAALVVVMHHCYRSVEDRAPRWLTLAVEGPLSPLVAGHFAVILFLVLSGFVLALPYGNGTNQPYPVYAARRVVRLYMPALFAIAFAWGLFHLVQAGHIVQGPGNVILASWNSPISAQTLGRHALLLGYPKSSVSLDLPLWSLIVELRASLVLPVLVGVVMRCGWWSILIGVATTLACGRINSLAGELSPYTAETLSGSLALTGRYLVFFIFGIIIAFRLPQLRQHLSRLKPAGHVAICALVAIANMLIIGHSLDERGYCLLLYGLFASYLVTCCVGFAAPARLLRFPVCVWLGGISFSLYLIHLPVLITAFYLLPSGWPAGIAVFAAIPLMLGLATVMQHTVTNPAADFSRHVGLYMTRRKPVTRVPG